MDRIFTNEEIRYCLTEKSKEYNSYINKKDIVMQEYVNNVRNSLTWWDKTFGRKKIEEEVTVTHNQITNMCDALNIEIQIINEVLKSLERFENLNQSTPFPLMNPHAHLVKDHLIFVEKELGKI